MQSYFNVIKNNSIISQGNKTINTNYSPVNEINEESIKNNIESYENLAKALMENARRQSDVILSKAYEEAQALEKDAYNRGYQNGQEQGYKDAYEETIEKASQQAQFLLDNANKVLLSAKGEYERHLADKQGDILQLIINIGERILKRELIEKDSINSMIYEVLESSRNTETFVIKVNPIYIEELKARVNDWKDRLALRGEIFLIPDECIELGNAEIEKNNGKVIVGIGVGMESIRQALC